MSERETDFDAEDRDDFEEVQDRFEFSDPDIDFDRLDEIIHGDDECPCLEDESEALCLDCRHIENCRDTECDEITHCECTDVLIWKPCELCDHDETCWEVDCEHNKDEDYDDPESKSEKTSDSSNPPNAGSFWTPEQDQTLVDMYVAEASFKSMATSLGRSVHAIQARLVKICFEIKGMPIEPSGLGKAKERIEWTPEIEQSLLNLIEQNQPLSAIAWVLEMPQLAVARKMVDQYLAVPGDIHVITYREGGRGSSSWKPWDTAQYFQLRQGFRAGLDIETLSTTVDHSVVECIVTLYNRGELKDEDFNATLESARGYVQED